MDTFRRFYLRLTLVQGLCLAVGFAFYALWMAWSGPNASVHFTQSSSLLSSPSSFPIDVTQFFSAASVIFLGTWGLLAGLSGWLLIKEQRNQWLAVLQQHDDCSAPDLRVLAEEEQEGIIEIPVFQGEFGLEAFEIVPPEPRLRLAMNEEIPWLEEEDEGEIPLIPRSAIRLRSECQLAQD